MKPVCMGYNWALVEPRGEALISHSSPRSIMSSQPVPSTSTPQPDFATIFNAALAAYNRKTKKDLTSNPLLPKLQSCNSPDAILAVLRQEIPTFSESENGDNRLTKWVMPTVRVLLAFSATIGQGVGLVNIRFFFVKNFHSYNHFQAYPPANIIVAGIGVLFSVGVHVPLPQPIFKPVSPRRLKTISLTGTSSLMPLTALNISCSDLRHILESIRL